MPCIDEVNFRNIFQLDAPLEYRAKCDFPIYIVGSECLVPFMHRNMLWQYIDIASLPTIHIPLKCRFIGYDRMHGLPNYKYTFELYSNPRYRRNIYSQDFDNKFIYIDYHDCFNYCNRYNTEFSFGNTDVFGKNFREMNIWSVAFKYFKHRIFGM